MIIIKAALNAAFFFKRFIKAINVNEVYKTVLSILNKEQRGYLTPYEFNNIATQVQLEIFESYFENLNQQLRQPENSSEYANRIKLLREKVNKFETSDTLTTVLGAGDLTTLATPVHRLGTLEYVNGNELPVTIQKTTRHDFNLVSRSKLTAPSLDWPIFYIEGDNVQIAPPINTTAGPLPPAQLVTVEYVRKPADVVWSYTIGAVGQYIYDSLTSVDFEIDDVDQTEVILKILVYAGVVIRDQEITQIAAGMAGAQDQLEQS